VPFSDMNVPRNLGWADDEMMAMAGIMRPEVRTKSGGADQPAHSGTVPTWVTASKGNMASRATLR
jgi:hypothetical protein